MGTTQIAHYVAGPSAYTPDGQFVLGSVPDVEGFYVASGCCGSGIGASGGVGRAIADLAIEGKQDLTWKASGRIVLDGLMRSAQSGEIVVQMPVR